MKKLLAILVCLALLLALPAGALAAQGDVLVVQSSKDRIEDNMSIDASCAVGDTLYMLSSRTKTLLVHRVGDTQATRYAIDLGVEDEYNQGVSVALVSDGETPVLLKVVMDYSGEKQKAEAGIYTVSFEGDQAVLTLLCEPDWETMRSEGGYFRYVESSIGLKDGLMFRTYDDRGESQIFRLNYADGVMTPVDVKSVYAMSDYTEGRVLFEIFDYNEPEKVGFQVYDPQSDSLEALGEVKVKEYTCFDGLVCDPENGNLYCVRGGEIHPIDLAKGEMGEGIADMPLDVYSNSNAAHILSGGYYAYATYGGYVVRNLNPDQQAQRRIKIQDWSYTSSVSDAYYQFINEHDDSMAILSRDGYGASLIDNMMNHDSSVDIYVMSSASKDYEAVFQRGFIADFGDNPVLAEMGGRINETLLKQLSVDGAFSVLPVDGYFWLPRFNQTAVEKLGMTVEEMPSNWSDFVDFLLELPSKMPSDGSVMLLDPYTSVTYARRELFTQIFRSYQTLLAQDPQAVNSQVMVEILEKLEKVDFTALGQPDDETVRREDFAPEYDENKILLNLNSGTQVSGIMRYNVPAVMALTPDTPAYLPMDTSVAFINPYSENIDLAREFMATLSENLSNSILYCLCQDLTEPTDNPYYAQNVADMEKYVASVEQALAEAEPEARQDREDELRRAREALERTREDKWEISQEDAAWLRAHDDVLVLSGSDWLYSDDSGEVYELVQQYAEGRIDARRLMKAIDGKIRMMLLEGN